MKDDWLSQLQEIVQKRRVALLQFQGDEWTNLCESSRGVTRFTIARSHDAFKGLIPPTACLIFGTDWGQNEAYIGVAKSRSAIATLESRLTVTRSLTIKPAGLGDLAASISDKRHATKLRKILASSPTATALPPMLSGHLVGRLYEIQSNRKAMRQITETLHPSKPIVGTAAVQEDAVQMALRAFGLSSDSRPKSLGVFRENDSALERISLMEDAVIEHDARELPGFELVRSHLTGYATFERGNERLEVYTANRRPLEKVFGVDLIYLNAIRQNIVMLQYKMLEPQDNNDWIYRPDSQLEREIKRMQLFSTKHTPGPYEYRINPQVFYLRFVKRDASSINPTITIPIDHYFRIRKDPMSKGPRGGLRVSFDSLDGRYLRQQPFLDLLRAGYIGAHAHETQQLADLVHGSLLNDKAVVAAIQSDRSAPQ